jgi:serine/threonine-protein kinase haspin
MESELPAVVAYDLEKDLTLFQSTHAPQCRVYRQMRSFLIHEDRVHLPPNRHAVPYPISKATGEPISWKGYYPYTNVLWLAYLYGYLISHFKGDKKELASFKKETAELWMHLDPGAPRDVLSFPSAGDVVRFAVEAGWVAEGQLVDVWGEGSRLEGVGDE